MAALDRSASTNVDQAILFPDGLEQMVSDIRRATRLLARAPGFTFLMTMLLAVGIGTTTTVFSFFEALFLRRLDARHPEELVRIVQRLPTVGTISSFPEAYYEALRERATTLALIFGEAGHYDRYDITVPAPAEAIAVRAVTPTFFAALGVQPLYGRVLLAEDDERRSETPPAVLSYRLWRRRFGGDPGVVNGTTMAVNGRYFAIVGVMPQPFNGITIDTSADAWIPSNAYRTLVAADGNGIVLELAGRLKPGFSPQQAEAECRTIWHSTMKEYYESVERRSEDETAQLVSRGVYLDSMERGQSILRDNFGAVLKIVMAATTLLLLVACLNIGGVLLTRAVARQHELAVRSALGASPFVLVRQVLAEGLVLGLLGGASGIVLAKALIPLATHLVPLLRDRSGAVLPLALSVGIDRQVLLIVLAVTLLAVLCFSLSPAILAYRSRVDPLLRSVRSIGYRRGREVLVSVQVALCTLLLVIASLFARTLQQLRRVDAGFDITRIATFTGHLGPHAGAEASAFLTTLRERVREAPGVLSASISSVAVLRGRGVSWTVGRAGEPITPAHFLNTSGNTVSADYFDTMGMRIVQGHGFAERATANVDHTLPTEAIINQAFATKFFPGSDPLGQHFGTAVDGVASAGYEVIGVVNDAKYRSLREPTTPVFYALGTPSDSFVLNVRASLRPDGIIESVRNILASMDPALPFREVHTMSEEVENSMASERLSALVGVCIGACAALFAGAGIYGSLSYLVTQRRRDIAIRMALGAGRPHTAMLVAKRTLLMVATGTLAGIIGASIAGVAVRSVLFKVSPQDGWSMASAIVFVALTAAAATAVPVIRAMRQQPADLLRSEN